MYERETDAFSESSNIFERIVPIEESRIAATPSVVAVSGFGAAAMGFETMRGAHSKMSNLAIALAVVGAFLAYSWWTASTQNYELLRQTDDIGRQLKVCSDEKLLCATRKNAIESRFRETEVRMADMKTAELKANDESTKSLRKAREDVEYCNAKLESQKKLTASKTSMADSLKLEKDALAAQLNQTREALKRLERELKAAKRTTPTDVRPIDAIAKYASPSTKSNPPNVPDPLVGDGPVNGADHESGSMLDNAAFENVDDPSDTLKRPTN